MSCGHRRCLSVSNGSGYITRVARKFGFDPLDHTRHPSREYKASECPELCLQATHQFERSTGSSTFVATFAFRFYDGFSERVKRKSLLKIHHKIGMQMMTGDSLLWCPVNVNRNHTLVYMLVIHVWTFLRLRLSYGHERDLNSTVNGG